MFVCFDKKDAEMFPHFGFSAYLSSIKQTDMTLQEMQAIRTIMTDMELFKEIFGEEFVSEDCVEALVYDSKSEMGYIEKLKDGNYYCVVANRDILDTDLTKVEQFLLDQWFN